MPHQCTRCGKIFPDASKELLVGCECGSRFFYYIRQEKLDELKSEVKKVMTELDKADKVQIEKDIRELTGLDETPDEPVILDLESVRVLRPGKFEIDIVNLFSKKRPLIYKLGEGKYIIDIVSSLGDHKEKFPESLRTDNIKTEESEEDEEGSFEESDAFSKSSEDVSEKVEIEIIGEEKKESESNP